MQIFNDPGFWATMLLMFSSLAFAVWAYFALDPKNKKKSD